VHTHLSSHTCPIITFGLAAFILLAPLASRAQTQDLFVANYKNDTISRFAGTGPGTFDTTAITLANSNPNTPFGLAFDAYGNLFASNAAGNTITEFAVGATPGTFGAVISFTAPA